MTRKKFINLVVALSFALFIIISFIIDFDFGIRAWDNFLLFAKDMLLILPPAFVLIGLFNVWAKRETIEKGFGQKSGFKKYIWSFLLASTTVGGTFMAFPVANALYHKGASYSSIFSYVTAASLFMIPMSVMEATILGIKFTAIRLLSSIPFIILTAIILEKIFRKQNYKIPESK
ncbi:MULTISPECIES: permease [Bacteria]|jgi:uncharacterized membrane protein YraQ (UPF0718 family)|uniref:Predicted permease n=1 Tax=Geotoga petraea TaxID=28234 RepID=A0A1G6PZ57_9BACT|nr:MULTISPECIES: permease [Bacteria]PUU87080.1 MAG: hypothetical protein CI949_3758 [Halanaerobium sp.]TGG86841.1 hypothetical protein E4650_09345 [Geotoga petraea]SDC84687.1 Predicted permease [Geotoga petraea]